ncbi:hypothetical protein H0H87_008251 [Tephrocybe sp. NHM501043]|nr:hypothetical protein H0H87_008251 [Tephrocybe sp. NHM501043]
MKDLTAPQLEGMRIVDDGAAPDSENFSPPSTFPLKPQILTGGTPKLAAVHTNNLDYPPPFTNLTTLHLRTSEFSSSHETDNEILSALIACPLLSTLSIHGDWAGDWTKEGVTLSNLRSVWFSGKDTLSAKFLTTVSLPRLESLWLHCPHYHVLNMIIDHYPRPTFPALKYLTLQTFDYYASVKASVVFPTIEALHLAFCNNFHVSFLQQALVEDALARWRNLHTLVFRTTRETYASKFSSVLNEVVIDRHYANRPIKKVLLDRDALSALSTANSVRMHTSLEELQEGNFDDPWWILSHTDTGDRL